jgi:2-(1,2-epoxy-1,2-dihydrophenyl)acetyl-CoA isomerase
MSEGTVRLDIEDGVGTITLSRPGKLNSLAGDMRPQLRDRIIEAAGSDLRALILQGEGDAFCAGGDVATMARLRDDGREQEFHRILHDGAECVLALRAFQGLTIAAVTGVAAGAGFALALGCDLCVATSGSRFAASWRGLALAPDWGGSFWLARRLGYANALELTLSGRVLDAAEALDLGLIQAVVEPDALDAQLQIWTEWARPRQMLQALKVLLRKGLDGTIEASLAAETEAQEDLFVSDDVLEGLRAFRDKRRPQFGRD